MGIFDAGRIMPPAGMLTRCGAGENSKKGLTSVSPNDIMVTQKGGEIVSPRTGRPTDDPKRHETRIRMSDEDVRILQECCEKAGMSKADVIRQGIREVYAKIKK